LQQISRCRDFMMLVPAITIPKIKHEGLVAESPTKQVAAELLPSQLLKMAKQWRPQAPLNPFFLLQPDPSKHASNFNCLLGMNPDDFAIVTVYQPLPGTT